VSADVQSTRALSLQQLDAVETYVTRVTSDLGRSGYAIRRVIEDGFYATVNVDGDSRVFVIAFSDRAANRLEARYDHLVIELDLTNFQDNEH